MQRGSLAEPWAAALPTTARWGLPAAIRRLAGGDSVVLTIQPEGRCGSGWRQDCAVEPRTLQWPGWDFPPWVLIPPEARGCQRRASAAPDPGANRALRIPSQDLGVWGLERVEAPFPINSVGLVYGLTFRARTPQNTGGGDCPQTAGGRALPYHFQRVTLYKG